MVISYELAISFEVWGIVGFVTMGALGGVSLGLALKRKVVALALLGAIGFGAGIFAGFYIGEEFGGGVLRSRIYSSIHRGRDDWRSSLRVSLTKLEEYYWV